MSTLSSNLAFVGVKKIGDFQNLNAGTLFSSQTNNSTAVNVVSGFLSTVPLINAVSLAVNTDFTALQLIPGAKIYKVSLKNNGTGTIAGDGTVITIQSATVAGASATNLFGAQTITLSSALAPGASVSLQNPVVNGVLTNGTVSATPSNFLNVLTASATTGLSQPIYVEVTYFSPLIQTS
jgi:hypothetical protein